MHRVGQLELLRARGLEHLFPERRRVGVALAAEEHHREVVLRGERIGVVDECRAELRLGAREVVLLVGLEARVDVFLRGLEQQARAGRELFVGQAARARLEEVRQRGGLVALQEAGDSGALLHQRQLRIERVALGHEAPQHRQRRVPVAARGLALGDEALRVEFERIERNREQRVLERRRDLLLLGGFLAEQEMRLAQRTRGERQLGIELARGLEIGEALGRAALVRERDDRACAQQLRARAAELLAAHDLVRRRIEAVARGVDLGRGGVDARILGVGRARLLDEAQRLDAAAARGGETCAQERLLRSCILRRGDQAFGLLERSEVERLAQRIELGRVHARPGFRRRLLGRERRGSGSGWDGILAAAGGERKQE